MKRSRVESARKYQVLEKRRDPMHQRSRTIRDGDSPERWKSGGTGSLDWNICWQRRASVPRACPPSSFARGRPRAVLGPVVPWLGEPCLNERAHRGANLTLTLRRTLAFANVFIPFCMQVITTKIQLTMHRLLRVPRSRAGGGANERRVKMTRGSVLYIRQTGVPEVQSRTGTEGKKRRGPSMTRAGHAATHGHGQKAEDGARVHAHCGCSVFSISLPPVLSRSLVLLWSTTIVCAWTWCGSRPPVVGGTLPCECVSSWNAWFACASMPT